jgi:hypothetical protein
VKKMVGSVVRHVLTFGGGAAVVSDEDITKLCGAIAALIGIAWSIWQKSRTAQENKPAQ